MAPHHMNRKFTANVGESPRFVGHSLEMQVLENSGRQSSHCIRWAAAQGQNQVHVSLAARTSPRSYSHQLPEQVPVPTHTN
jgi:hypothetical protein